MDYESVSTILTFPECATQSCVNIVILDDVTVEMNQTFSISLDSTDMRIIVDSDFVGGTEVDGEVVIVDNECECYSKGVSETWTVCSFNTFCSSSSFSC